MDKLWNALKHLKDILSLPYRSLIILVAICAAIVFTPAAIWEQLGVSSLEVAFRQWAFPIGLMFTAWLFMAILFDLVMKAINHIRSQRGKRANRDSQERLLLQTSRVEREVLATYVARDSTTLAFDARDGIVNGLVAKGILIRASTASNPFGYDFDINIQPWAWAYLVHHRDLLHGIQPLERPRHHVL